MTHDTGSSGLAGHAATTMRGDEMTAAVAVNHVLPRSPRQVLLAGAGLVAVALGAIGAVVPGMPTTVFLLVASYCFAQSCPWLGTWLRRSRLFAPYARVLDPAYVMSARARLTSLGSMWASVVASLGLLALGGRLSAVLLGLILAAAIAGTVAICRFRRRRA